MEWWNNFVSGLEEFWNQPVPIIGFTVGTLIVGFFVIFTKTSLGKKALNWCKTKYEELLVKYNEAKKLYEEVIAEKDAIIEELTKMYEEKLALVQLNKDKEKEIIIAIAKNINNVKIKKIIEEYEKLPEITDISDYVEEIKAKYEAKESEITEKLNEVLSRLEELENGKISEEIKEEISNNSI